ncbi:MAG: carboxymuconolactone decarboxylase family protein [Phycisphaerales bacterium]|nr:carboxymuconolactone decarboxylase family protein [Phycisphaerales bacterium]
MPRLNVVDPAHATGKAKELFEGPLKGMQINIFKGMANSPAALAAYLGMAGALKEGMLTEKEREVIALALAEAAGCHYCQAAHTMLGRRAGLSEAETLDARRGALSDSKLGALARFVLALNEKRGHVSDADIAAMKSAGYTDGHIAEAVAVVALNTYTNYFNNVNQTTVDFPPAPPLR